MQDALATNFLASGWFAEQEPECRSPGLLDGSFQISFPNFFRASVCFNDYKILKLLLEKWFVIARKTHYKKHFCIFTLEHGY